MGPGVEKTVEAQEAAAAFGVDLEAAKRLFEHAAFYSYPGGHSFFDFYVDMIDRARQLALSARDRSPVSSLHS